MNGHVYIKNSWILASELISRAFTLTIFGYGAPETDGEAKDLLHKAWFSRSNREFEHIEIIDIKDAHELANTWSPFSPPHHLKFRKNIEESWLWLYPRRSSEALCFMMEGSVTHQFPVRKTNSLTNLQSDMQCIAKYES